MKKKCLTYQLYCKRRKWLFAITIRLVALNQQILRERIIEIGQSAVSVDGYSENNVGKLNEAEIFETLVYPGGEINDVPEVNVTGITN